MIKSKSWLTNAEIETIRRKIENKGRDQVTDGIIQENDIIVDLYDENDDVSYADSANEGPIEITQNDLSNSERDRLLRLREVLEDNDFGKTELNQKYGDKKKLKEQVIKMNVMLEVIKVTAFTHCRMWYKQQWES